MSKRFSDRILDFLNQPGYEPLRTRKLAKAMGVAAGEMGDFHDAVDALRRVGRIVIGSHSSVMLQNAPAQITGTFRANPRGFGFVVPDETTEHGDLYIAQGDSADAMTGDRVICEVMNRGKRDGKQAFGGRILKVVERGNSKFVGELKLDGTTWYVEAGGNTMHGPVLIGDPHAHGARSGDQVVIEIARYPSDGKPAQGVIVERLGQGGEPGVDLKSIIRQYHLPEEFPEPALDETRRLARYFDPTEEEKRREDLSDHVIITIDPDTARDFDDAISLTKIQNNAKSGNAVVWHGARKKHGPAVWELGVHIADVSTFVRIDSELDTEARKRGTSVYLPGKVIPMLPEILSNGLCSLQEAEPRLCKSAFIRYDAEGRVVATRFANTIIRSKKRLTYGQRRPSSMANAAISKRRSSIS
ncbi:MAG: RNB domain-containing ribonuclease [Planctomycetes bacterium]|nr:RNB domain-containing ribonuclease [Planctomycetota bacterium]